MIRMNDDRSVVNYEWRMMNDKYCNDESIDENNKDEWCKMNVGWCIVIWGS